MCCKLKELINRYIEVSLSVHRRGDRLTKQQLISDLTVDQHYTMRFVASNGECTSTELAQHFDVEKSAVTSIIKRLVDKKLISRRRDQNDRRVVYLSLTEEGRKLYDECEERIYKIVGNFISKFNDEEISGFIKTYEKLNRLLAEFEKNGDETTK
ncbi:MULTISPECIES: MarR family winged helix-turn-helix transcriptional regulator [Bacillus]|uniref:MarR family transcriptional regulator n=2 Tax=Bacillus TaxID=1386 RepID=A0A0M4FRA8_9BACI|nr:MULTISPECIES: MarR family transcriptional regulator [Bacillus]ALC80243.1 MarR family transcriptional regulator [Bacillus gobiensis]MBP1082765.1 DNA-binding MarR family transcriptional regulator [Bacillus capparidis]MED1098409.1 MarR family transcriptional regulator [Bacillus capparidis]